MKRRVLSIVLALSLVLSAVPSVATNAAEVDVVENGEISEAGTEKGTNEATDEGEKTVAKMVGSDGIEYDGVEYLPVSSIKAMSAENQKVYKEMCDDIANIKKSDDRIRDFAISVDEDGKLTCSYFVPFEIVADRQLDLAGINEDEVEVLYLEDETEEHSTETSQEASTEQTAVAENKETEISEESSVEEKQTEQAIVGETATEETTVEETTVAEIKAEEAQTENVTECINVDADNSVWSENVSVLDYKDIKEEYLGDEYLNSNSILPNNNYFKNQLSAFSKMVYDSAYSAIVQNGKTAFTFKTDARTYNAGGSAGVSDGISAVVLTYPSKFDWTSKSGGWKSSYSSAGGGKYNFTVNITKSKHYNSSLETQADNKVAAIKAQALSYAQKNYKTNQVYGTVKYFDSWVCKNNYYNYPSLKMDDSNEIFFYCHSSFGILLKGYGVCESYALAMSRLLDSAGIPNIYVLGYANNDPVNGGHAWNYVQMPDGKWYLLDSTWNNPSTSAGNVSADSTGDYLLVKNDGRHTATGKSYNKGKNFSFPAISKADYVPSEKHGAILVESLALKKGQSTSVINNSAYYKGFTKTCSSNNEKVATVDKNGVVKAVGPGKAVVSVKVGEQKADINVLVHNITSVVFEANNKNSFTYEHGDTDGKFDSADLVTVKLTVKQPEGASVTAAELNNAKAVTTIVKSSNEKLATINNVSVSGNTIIVKVQPKTLGTAKISVDFAGKKATLTLGIKQKLQGAWFSGLEYTAKEYTGAAYKPKFTKTEAAPAKLAYKTQYLDNKDAGTATVKIIGTGMFTGEIVKTFKITPVNITNAELKVTKATNIYNAAHNPTVTSVKINKKTLRFNADKAKTDYIIKYNGTEEAKNVGQYKITIVGNKNYTGTVTQTGVYEITAAPINKLAVVCPATIKYTGTNIQAVTAVKIGKNVVDPSNYTVKYYLATDKDLVKAVTPNEKGKYVAVVTPKGNNIAVTDKAKFIKKTFTVK